MTLDETYNVRSLLLNSNSNFAVMKTGKVVVTGRKGGKPHGPKRLYLLTLKKKTLKTKHLKLPCQHDVSMLDIEIAGREYLAFSCNECHVIRLLNLKTREEVDAFHHEKVDQMCKGAQGTLFATLGGSEVIELDCSSPTFTRIKTIEVDSRISGLCYIPSPHRLIVTSHSNVGAKNVQAISCDTNEKMWTVEGKVNGQKILPSGTVFSSHHDSIVVVDLDRVLILNPEGCVLVTVELGMGSLWSLSPNKKNLFVLHTESEEANKATVSKLSVINVEIRKVCRSSFTV